MVIGAKSRPSQPPPQHRVPRIVNRRSIALFRKSLPQHRDRALAAPTFPAGGLYLTRVEYDRALDLPIGADVVMPCAP